MKTYYLTIKYDEENHIVEYINEETITDEMETSIMVGDVDITDYWDDDSMDLVNRLSSECGES